MGTGLVLLGTLCCHWSFVAVWFWWLVRSCHFSSCKYGTVMITGQFTRGVSLWSGVTLLSEGCCCCHSPTPVLSGGWGSVILSVKDAGVVMTQVFSFSLKGATVVMTRMFFSDWFVAGGCFNGVTFVGDRCCQCDHSVFWLHVQSVSFLVTGFCFSYVWHILELSVGFICWNINLQFAYKRHLWIWNRVHFFFFFFFFF